MSKVFGAAPVVAQSTIARPATSPTASPATAASPQTASSAPSAPPIVPQAPVAAAVATSTPPFAGSTGVVPATVDVTAILDGFAVKNAEKLDWRKSIVDLMKLVGMDSSLAARKELASELKYSGDMNDSAKMNIWLHKEVIRKMAENGGKVPPDLLD